jgi:voltage-gated potassium channel Kch
MINELLLGLGLTGMTVPIHAFGAVFVVLPLAGIWTRVGKSGKTSAAVLPLTRLVSGLLLLHLFEMSIWAIAFAAIGVLPNFETSLYYSLMSYTTVGYGDVVPPAAWRLIGPIEAAVGVLMLGWSTGFVVAAVQRIYGNFDRTPSSS